MNTKISPGPEIHTKGMRKNVTSVRRATSWVFDRDNSYIARLFFLGISMAETSLYEPKRSLWQCESRCVVASEGPIGNGLVKDTSTNEWPRTWFRTNIFITRK